MAAKKKAKAKKATRAKAKKVTKKVLKKKPARARQRTRTDAPSTDGYPTFEG